MFDVLKYLSFKYVMWKLKLKLKSCEKVIFFKTNQKEKTIISFETSEVIHKLFFY